MKKLLGLGLLLVLSTGCGHRLLPGIFRGGRCNGCGMGGLGASLPAEPVAAGGECTNCSDATVGYGSYEGSAVEGDYYSGGVINENVISDNVVSGGIVNSGYSGNSYPSTAPITSPSMSALPAP